jgi:glycosyltransferase involved in cell wall biosynthesis
VNALLVPPGNADALADALRRVLVDRPLVERLAAAGLQLAAENSEEAMVERYLDLYERVRG